MKPVPPHPYDAQYETYRGYAAAEGHRAALGNFLNRGICRLIGHKDLEEVEIGQVQCRRCGGTYFLEPGVKYTSLEEHLMELAKKLRQ